MAKSAGALFQLGVLQRPPFADKTLHVLLSQDPVAPPVSAARCAAVAAGLEERGYCVWGGPPVGRPELQFAVGVAESAAVCVCLSAGYSASARTRTELVYAADCAKPIVVLVSCPCCCDCDGCC